MTDANDITLSSYTVDENTPNAVVGTASTQGGAGGETYTYSLVAGTGDTDNGEFSFSGDQLELTNAGDYEVKSTYSIRVRTTDTAGPTYEKAITITLNDLDDPNSITFDSTRVNENAAAELVG